MLPYLFTAHFTDDTTLQQTPEDVSSFDVARSAFYDVQQALDAGKQLASFALVGNGHTYAVDLQDGHFEVNGAPLWLIPEGLQTDPEAFRVICFRQHTHHFNAATNEEQAHHVRFILGWQTTVDGRNFQQTITLD